MLIFKCSESQIFSTSKLIYVLAHLPLLEWECNLFHFKWVDFGNMLNGMIFIFLFPPVIITFRKSPRFERFTLQLINQFEIC